MTLRQLFHWCCEQYPTQYVSLDCTVDRHSPLFSPETPQVEYRFYIDTVLMVTAHTPQDLVQQVQAALANQPAKFPPSITQTLDELEAWGR